MIRFWKLSFKNGVFIITFCECENLQELISLETASPEWEVKCTGQQLMLTKTFFFLAGYQKNAHVHDQGQCAISFPRVGYFCAIIETPHVPAKPTARAAHGTAVWPCRCRFCAQPPLRATTAKCHSRAHHLCTNTTVPCAVWSAECKTSTASLSCC